jgi:hypothetical protein
MTKKSLLVNSILGAALFCGSVTLAQTPVQNIDMNKHPNLAQAQNLVAQANNFVIAAQKDDRYDMRGHAKNARQFLVQASQEMKAAAIDADAVEWQKK